MSTARVRKTHLSPRVRRYVPEVSSVAGGRACSESVDQLAPADSRLTESTELLEDQTPRPVHRGDIASQGPQAIVCGRCVFAASAPTKLR